jgi:hypothetical protein
MSRFRFIAGSGFFFRFFANLTRSGDTWFVWAGLFFLYEHEGNTNGN